MGLPGWAWTSRAVSGHLLQHPHAPVLATCTAPGCSPPSSLQSLAAGCLPLAAPWVCMCSCSTLTIDLCWTDLVLLRCRQNGQLTSQTLWFRLHGMAHDFVSASALLACAAAPSTTSPEAELRASCLAALAAAASVLGPQPSAQSQLQQPARAAAVQPLLELVPGLLDLVRTFCASACSQAQPAASGHRDAAEQLAQHPGPVTVLGPAACELVHALLQAGAARGHSLASDILNACSGLWVSQAPVYLAP